MQDFAFGGKAREFFAAFQIENGDGLIAFVRGEQASAVVSDREVVDSLARGNAACELPGVRVDFDDLARLVAGDVN